MPIAPEPRRRWLTTQQMERGLARTARFTNSHLSGTHVESIAVERYSAKNVQSKAKHRDGIHQYPEGIFMGLNSSRGCLRITVFILLTLTANYSSAEVFLDLDGSPVLGTVITTRKHKPAFLSCSGALYKIEGQSLRRTGLTCSDLGLKSGTGPVVSPSDTPTTDQSRTGKYPTPPGCDYCDEKPRQKYPSIFDGRVPGGPTPRNQQPFE